MKKSLQIKFLTTFFSGFLLISILAYLAFENILDHVIVKLGKHFAEKQVLYDKERSLNPIQRELTLAKKMANTHVIIKWLKNEKNSALKKMAIAELEGFRNAFNDKSYFLAIKSSKNYYYNNAKNEYKNREIRYHLNEKSIEDQWFFKTLKQNNECLLNVDYDEKLKVTKLWINCIIKEGNNKLGITGTGIELNQFIKNIVELPQEGVNNIFIDQSGAIQLHRKKKMIDFRSISKNIQQRKTIFQLIDCPQTRKQFHDKMLSLKQAKSRVETLFIHMSGHRYLAGIAYLKEFGWYNITLMNIKVLIGKHFFTPFIILTGTALIILLLVLSLFFKILTLNKIKILDKSIPQLDTNDFRINIRGSDEFSRLARQIESMAVKIHQNKVVLEKTVQERTAELQKANEMKETFFAILAHDLKGPIGNLKFILENFFEPHTSIEPDDYNMLTKSVGGVYHLLENLLNWALAKRGLLNINLTNFCIDELVHESLDVYDFQIKQKNISIDFSDLKKNEIYADRSMIGTVIRNFISNAIKFTPEKGTIKILSSLEKKTFKFEICDSGTGISEKKQKRLFRLGETQISTPGTANEIGKGFGLILCKRFIELHQGEIGVKSNPHQGSCFWFALKNKS